MYIEIGRLVPPSHCAVIINMVNYIHSSSDAENPSPFVLFNIYGNYLDVALKSRLGSGLPKLYTAALRMFAKLFKHAASSFAPCYK